MAKKPKTSDTANERTSAAAQADLAQSIAQLNNRMATLEQRSVGQPIAAPYPQPKPEGCDCAKAPCCCFEVYLSRVRVIEGQGPLEPGDGGAVSQNLELIFNAMADGIGSVFPSLASHIQLSRKLGWVAVNKRLNTITVKGTRSVPVIVEARETGDASELRPEFGSSQVHQLTLACGCPVVPIQIKVELSAGGRAGGSVEAEISAREVCCEGC